MPNEIHCYVLCSDGVLTTYHKKSFRDKSFDNESLIKYLKPENEAPKVCFKIEN